MHEIEQLEKNGAAGEALGLYFDIHGSVAGGRGALGLRAQDMGTRIQTAAIACGRSKAEAIMAVCLHHPHKLLVTDEGAALRMMELLRV
jgi:central glycolytic genes regulator